MGVINVTITTETLLIVTTCVIISCLIALSFEHKGGQKTEKKIIDITTIVILFLFIVTVITF